MGSTVKDLLFILRNCGVSYTTHVIVDRLYYGRKQTYGEWIKWKEAQYHASYQFTYQPKISIVVPVYNVKRDQLVTCIESVLQQSYPNVELCMSDDCSTLPEVKEVLEAYSKNEKVKLHYREKNGHISENTNSAIALATGEFIGFLDCDDFLAKNAVAEIVQALNQNPSLDFIYTDEDLVTEDGVTRFSPILKPDWSPDTYFAHNYTNHFSVYRAEIVKKIGGLRTAYNGSQDYDFVLRFIEHTDATKIAHIPKILYHWRSRPESVASGNDAKPYVFDAAKRAKEDAMQRRGIKGHLEYGEKTKQWNIVYHVEKEESICILLYANKNLEDTKRTYDSICNHTSYENYKVGIVVPQEQTIQREAYIKNFADAQIVFLEDGQEQSLAGVSEIVSTCNYVTILEAGVEIQTNDWLQSMLGHLQQTHVGMVGAKVCYKGNVFVASIGKIQSPIGMLDAFAHFRNEDNLYLGLNHNFITVAEQCFMVKKECIQDCAIFLNNPQKLSVVLAQAARQQGLYAVTRPDVMVSILPDIQKEISKLEEKGSQECKQKKDSFYNENLSQTLPFSLGTFLSPKQEEKGKYDTGLKATIQYHLHKGMLLVVGIVLPCKGKRSLFDRVWVEIELDDRKIQKVHLEKKYLAGLSKLKKGYQWAGVQGSILLGRKDSTVRFRICQKGVGKRIYATDWYEAKE